MKKFTFIAMSLFAVLFLGSCNAIEKATEMDAEMGDMELTMTCQTKAAVEGSITISINDPQFSEFKKRIGWIKSITFSSVEIQGPSSYGVTDFTLKANTGETSLGELTVASHDFKEPYIYNTATNSMVQNALNSFIKKNTVTMTVDGQTNMTEGEAMELTLIVRDVVVHAGLKF